MGVFGVVQGLGEVFSARLLGAALRRGGGEAVTLDAREVLVVARDDMGTTVDWPASERRFGAWRLAHPAARVVATGFIARDSQWTSENPAFFIASARPRPAWWA